MIVLYPLKGEKLQRVFNGAFTSLGLLFLLISVAAANPRCWGGTIETSLGLLKFEQNEILLAPYSNSGQLMPSLFFGIRILGLAEVRPMTSGSCHFDPGFPKWTNPHQRFSLLDDLNCTSTMDVLEMPNGANLIAFKSTFVTDLHPDFVLNITTSVIDREYVKPIVPGYNATYSPSKVKFDADIVNWPWMENDSNVAMFAQVLFPTSSDFVIEASSNRSMRSIQYSNSEGVILALSTETDFVVDGVHYQTASKEVYENVPQIPAVPFAIGFCNGANHLHRWTKLSYDPTLSYLFPTPESSSANTTGSAKRSLLGIVGGVIFAVLFILVIAGCIFIYYRYQALHSDSTKKLAQSLNSGNGIASKAAAASPNCEMTKLDEEKSSWSPASKPSLE